MSDDRYHVKVERWSEGAAGAMSERAAQCGLDARAVEVDLCIRKVKPDVPIESLEHRFLVMTLRAAGGELYVADLGYSLRGLTVSAEGDHLLVAGTYRPTVHVWPLAMPHRAQEGA